MFNKSCFNCVTSNKSAGFGGNYYEPPEPPMAECTNPEVAEEVLESVEYNEDKLPVICGHYQPVMIPECCYCRKPINQPVAEWPYWASCWDAAPVCSPECKEALQSKFDREVGGDYS